MQEQANLWRSSSRGEVGRVLLQLAHDRRDGSARGRKPVRGWQASTWRIGCARAALRTAAPSCSLFWRSVAPCVRRIHARGIVAPGYVVTCCATPTEPPPPSPHGNAANPVPPIVRAGSARPAWRHTEMAKSPRPPGAATSSRERTQIETSLDVYADVQTALKKRLGRKVTDRTRMMKLIDQYLRKGPYITVCAQCRRLDGRLYQV